MNVAVMRTVQQMVMSIIVPGLQETVLGILTVVMRAVMSTVGKTLIAAAKIVRSLLDLSVVAMKTVTLMSIVVERQGFATLKHQRRPIPQLIRLRTPQLILRRIRRRTPQLLHRRHVLSVKEVETVVSVRLVILMRAAVSQTQNVPQPKAQRWVGSPQQLLSLGLFARS
jgi:hypothetical protein